MVATSFQLAGALLLGYMIAFRKKKEIIISSSIIVVVQGKKPEIAEDKWIETYGYRIGFLYIIIGYLLPLIEKDFPIPIPEKLYLIFFIDCVLLIMGISISNVLGKRSFDKMTPQDFYENSPKGSMMIEILDDEINKH